MQGWEITGKKTENYIELPNWLIRDAETYTEFLKWLTSIQISIKHSYVPHRQV